MLFYEARKEQILAAPSPILPRDATTSLVALVNRANDILGYSVIDTCDAPLVSSYRWRLKKCKSGKQYAEASPWVNHKPTTIGMHRLITGAPSPGRLHPCDHINGDGLDNRRENLRLVTNQQNQQNRVGAQSNNRSGYRGVHWNKADNGYHVKVYVGGKEFFLGRYKDPVEAGKIAANARRELMTHSSECELKAGRSS